MDATRWGRPLLENLLPATAARWAEAAREQFARGELAREKREEKARQEVREEMARANPLSSKRAGNQAAEDALPMELMERPLGQAGERVSTPVAAATEGSEGGVGAAGGNKRACPQNEGASAVSPAGDTRKKARPDVRWTAEERRPNGGGSRRVSTFSDLEVASLDFETRVGGNTVTQPAPVTIIVFPPTPWKRGADGGERSGWTADENRSFFSALRAFGPSFDRIREEVGANKTKEQVPKPSKPSTLPVSAHMNASCGVTCATEAPCVCQQHILALPQFYSGSS